VEFSILAAAADRIAPAAPGFPSPEEAEVAERIDALLAGLHPGLAGEIRQLLHLFDNALAQLVLDGKPRTFTSMDAAEQDAVLRSWQTSGLALQRTGFVVLKGLVVAAYHANPITYEAVGYPGPPDVSGLPPTTAPAARSSLEGLLP
jgi:hypothetical protein